MKNFYLLLLLVFFHLPLSAALTPQARSYLEKLPEKKITLPVVIKLALENADAYRIYGFDYATADLEELGQVSPLTDTYFTAGGQYIDDNSVKPNPFQPLRTKRWEWNTSLQKNWGTGTTTSLGWIHDTNALEFELPPGLAGDFLTDYKQSIASVQLEQSLLKDSFGSTYRDKLQAARKRSQAIKWKAREDIEGVTLQFVSEYYNSWLLQEQVKSLQEQVQRQERLVKILSQRNKKGVVETPELMQFKALLASTKSRYSQAQSMLANQWQKLVTSLKLPSELAYVDPIEIPTSIDDPGFTSLKACAQKAPTKTAGIHSIEKNLEALDSDYQAAQGDSLPDLKFVAGYRGNSIDASASETVRNVFRGNQENSFGRGPAWNAGLQLIWPLSNSASQAQRAQKYIQREQTSARLRLAVDDLQTTWKDVCRRLKVELENERRYRQVVSEQKNRVRAEERRFRLGRSRVDQLVTAEDDLGSWEYNSQQKAIEVRQLAWQVQKMSGQLYETLSPYIDNLLGEMP